MPKFDKPVNEWIEEEVDVPVFKPRVNEKLKRVEFVQGTEKATKRTYYAKSDPRKVVCAPGQHFFYPENRKKSIFACNRCNYHKIAYPVTYKYNSETGQLIHKITQKEV